MGLGLGLEHTPRFIIQLGRGCFSDLWRYLLLQIVSCTAPICPGQIENENGIPRPKIRECREKSSGRLGPVKTHHIFNFAC